MPKKTKPVVLNQFNTGGLADSPWSGIANSMSSLVGLDLHSVPGIVKPRHKLSKDSGSTITELCKFSIATSRGRNYWFSSTSGKIWEEFNGTYTLVYTTVPTSGAASCTGAYEYDGYLYWATQNYLHKIDIALINNWTASATPNITLLANGESYHPMLEVNGILFIGDGKDVHQVDGTLFTSSALDIKQPHVVKSLGQVGTDLLVGTEIAGTTGKAGIYRWDTYSISYLTFDPIPEDAVNAFLKADNYTYAQAGGSGNIYVYNGEKMELYYKIPGEYSSTAKSIVHSDAVALMNGQILFGLSNSLGDPSLEGVYMIGRNSRNYRYVMDLSFPISSRFEGNLVLNNLEIGSIMVKGFDMWVSWRYGATYGVDKIDYSTRLDGAYMESRYMIFDRPNTMTVNEIVVAYQDIPTNCNFSLFLDKDYQNSYAEQDLVIDADRNTMSVQNARDEINVMKLKLIFTTSGNTTPVLESIAVTLDG